MPRTPPTLGPLPSPVDTPSPPAPLERDYAPTEPPRRKRRLWPWLLVLLVLLVLASPLLVVLALRYVPPPTTAFMLQSPVKPVQYHWVPAAQIPPALGKAAVASEDQKFYEHNGFDFEAIEKALASNKTGKKVRGASTISQQVAKNLFLWPSRSYVRKGFEVGATLALEWLWTKDRILEMYLNIAEFGPGIYGVDAAAQTLFGKPAAKLSAAECAQLIAVLPNPRKWKAAHPGPYVQRRTDWILGQIGAAPRYAAVPAEEPTLPESGPPADATAAEPPAEAAPEGPSPEAEATEPEPSTGEDPDADRPQDADPDSPESAPPDSMQIESGPPR